MERLRERVLQATRALATLNEVIRKEPTEIERDAAIQRFEYSVEATWKACQRYLNIVEGLTCGSPKQCVRLARDVSLLSDEDAILALQMIDDRNLTSHTYNQDLAVKIYSHLANYVGLLDRWLSTMSNNL